METRASGESSAPGSADHSGVRLPPPLIYVVLFLLALGLQTILPLPAIPPAIGLIGGPVLTIGGVLLSGWSIGRFRRARTSVIPIRPTTTLVIEGPYRFTRNPMYLSLAMVYLGLALWTQKLWVLLLAPLVILAVQQMVIRKEEQYLQRKFGEQYTLYRASVRRWI